MSLRTYATAHIRLSFVPAPSDLEIESAELQTIFGRFYFNIRTCGIALSSSMYYDPNARGAGGFTGTFALPLNHAMSPKFNSVLIAWFEGGRERTVALRIGDHTVEAPSFDMAKAWLRNIREVLANSSTGEVGRQDFLPQSEFIQTRGRFNQATQQLLGARNKLVAAIRERLGAFGVDLDRAPDERGDEWNSKPSW
jgi:hypothetical protein